MIVKCLASEKQSDIPDAARRQRPAGQKTKSCMCPCGPRRLSGRPPGGGPCGPGPPNFGRVSRGAFVPQPLAGKLWRRCSHEVPCWCAESGVLCAPGGRGGGGLGTPALQHGRRGPRQPRGREIVAPTSWPVTRGPELVSGRSMDSPLKSNCCHV